MYPLIANLGPTEIILIVLVIVLLFGARKLPELARGTGQALRIFRSETKRLDDEDQPEQKPQSPHELGQPRADGEDVIRPESQRDAGNG